MDKCVYHFVIDFTDGVPPRMTAPYQSSNTTTPLPGCCGKPVDSIEDYNTGRPVRVVQISVPEDARKGADLFLPAIVHLQQIRVLRRCATANERDFSGPICRCTVALSPAWQAIIGLTVGRESYNDRKPCRSGGRSPKRDHELS